MPAIIEEIQREALRPDARVGGLLRMVKLAAAKLKLTDVGDWVEHELKGYPLDSTVPEYRVVRGELKAFNPFNGWIPITGPGVAELSQRYIAQPITAIEDILSRMQVGESHTLTVPLPPKVVEALDRSGEIAFGRYALMIDRGAAVQMVEAVRNLVLDWAIQMEASGVTGSDFSFTPEERDAAKAAPSPIQIGSIHTFAGNLGGSGNTTGDITIGHVDVPAAAALTAQIERYMPQLQADGVRSNDLRTALDILHAEVAKSEPRQGAIRGALVDLRNALSGAGGSLLATGILEGISKLLG